MATPIRAPERQPAPANAGTLKRQRLDVRLLSRQMTCVLILVLTDLLAVAFSLEITIFMRTHLVPGVDAHLWAATFPLEYHLSSGWFWLLPVVFLSVEGLYTRRRSLWNEVGHITKAVGLGLVIFLA